jgi:DNA-binding transcriptional MerR regulator
MNFNFETPSKTVYKFHEITSITGVKPYVLRFWETEFSQINPTLSTSGEKLYSVEDLECIQKIKKLLFEDKLSIPEAKLELNQQPVTEQLTVNSSVNIQSASEKLKQDLEAIIEKNSRPLSTGHVQQPVERIEKNFKLSNQDIVNLVTAKKKLTVLLNRIDQISQKHDW